MDEWVWLYRMGVWLYRDEVWLSNGGGGLQVVLLVEVHYSIFVLSHDSGLRLHLLGGGGGEEGGDGEGAGDEAGEDGAEDQSGMDQVGWYPGVVAAKSSRTTNTQK